MKPIVVLPGAWKMSAGACLESIHKYTNLELFIISEETNHLNKQRHFISSLQSLPDLNVGENELRIVSNCPIPEELFSEQSELSLFFIWPTMSIKFPVLLVSLGLVSADVLKHFIFHITKLLSSWHERAVPVWGLLYLLKR